MQVHVIQFNEQRFSRLTSCILRILLLTGMEGKGEEGKWEGRQEALGPCLQWPFQDFINGPKSLLPILILILPDIFFYKL